MYLSSAGLHGLHISTVSEPEGATLVIQKSHHATRTYLTSRRVLRIPVSYLGDPGFESRFGDYHDLSLT
jgi:hypothetical protein